MAKYLIIPDRKHFAESQELAKKYNLGFEFNDFFNPKMLDNKDKLEEVISFYKGNELPELITTHGDFFDVLVFSDDDEIVRISERRIRESIEVGVRLGCKAVIVHSNVNPYLTAEICKSNWLVRNELFFRKVCEEYPNISILMENMFDQNPDDMVKLAERLEDVDNFGICLDYAHAYISRSSVTEWVKALAPYIMHVHINDNDGENDQHLAVGDGVVDWKKFLTLQKEYFPDATVLVETSSLENQRKSLEYMDDEGFFWTKK